jgi:hypothetical protein
MPIQKYSPGIRKNVPQVIFGSGDISIVLARKDDDYDTPCLLLVEDHIKDESEWNKSSSKYVGLTSGELTKPFVELVFPKKKSLEVLIDQLQLLLEEGYK